MHRTRLFLICFSALLLAGVGQADAQITDIQVTSSASVDPTGFVVNDLSFSFNGQFTSVGLLTSGLSAGDIYQDGAGGDTAPTSAAVSGDPSLATDTFVQFGADTSDTSITPSFAGGAVELGGAATATFNNQLLDVTYFTTPGIPVTDESNYFVGRLTFANTANGTLDISTFLDDFFFYNFQIYNGYIFDPSAFLIGDMNGDGDVNNLDINPFALALTNVSAYNSQFPGIDPDVVGDVNGDDVLNNLDINPFADLLTGGSSSITTVAGLQALVVPEPTSLALFAAVGLLLRRQTR